MANSQRREMDRLLAESGWTVIRQNGRSHPIARCPCGEHSVAISISPSDWRSLKNFRAQLRRCPESSDLDRRPKTKTETARPKEHLTMTETVTDTVTDTTAEPPMMELTNLVLDTVKGFGSRSFTTNDVLADPVVGGWFTGHGIAAVEKQRTRVNRVLVGRTATAEGVVKVKRSREGESLWRVPRDDEWRSVDAPAEVEAVVGSSATGTTTSNVTAVPSNDVVVAPTPVVGVVAPPAANPVPFAVSARPAPVPTVVREPEPEPEPEPERPLAMVSGAKPELALDEVLEIVGKVRDTYLVRDTKGQLYGLRRIELTIE